MDASASLRLPPRPSPLAAGLRALQRFWRPFLLIQGAALALGLAYRFSAPVRAACAALMLWKTSGGLPFVMITGALAGGILPEVAKALVDRKTKVAKIASVANVDRQTERHSNRLREVLFNTAFFAINGAVIDGLYRSEARIFGDDARVATIVAKTAFDQFVFTPLWSSVIAALFLFRARGFSWAATRPALRAGFFPTRVVPLLLPNFCFWIPIVSVVYALPSPLQFLMFAFALAAWSLIMVFITGQDPEQSGS